MFRKDMALLKLTCHAIPLPEVGFGSISSSMYIETSQIEVELDLLWVSTWTWAQTR